MGNLFCHHALVPEYLWEEQCDLTVCPLAKHMQETAGIETKSFFNPFEE